MDYPLLLPSSTDHLLTLTHPSKRIWVVELCNGDDSRLTRHLILDAILPALDHVEREWRHARMKARQGDKTAGQGSLVITGNLSQNKFFSNGLVLEAALAEDGFWKNIFHPYMIRILTFPLPTVASINGHAFAGGWLLAAACDYRVMSSGKCWGSMPEIFLGSDFPHLLIVLLRRKMPNHAFLRKQVLEGHRWTPQELLAAGMVDELVDGGSKLVLRHAIAVAEKQSINATAGNYGLIKRELYRGILEAGNLDTRLVTPEEDDKWARQRLPPNAKL